MMRTLPLVILVCLGLAGPLAAKPDADLQALIRAALNPAADPERLLLLADRLAAGVIRPLVPRLDTLAANYTVQVEHGEIQAALTQLSILSGGNGHLSLQMAQLGQLDVIHLLAGDATPADLETVGDLVMRDGQTWYLSRPLVIWPEASLRLSPGETLEMDTAAGSFLLAFGDLLVTGATLQGDAGVNPAVPEFRPFVLVGGQGSFRADKASFANLGFPGPDAFRGVSVTAGGLIKPPFPTVVTKSFFDRVGGISFQGVDGLSFTDNRLHQSGGPALSVRDARNVVLAGNRITETANGAGIRLSGRLEHVLVGSNLIAQGARNGVQVDGFTQGLILRGNVVTGNAGTGISIRHADCIAVQGNIIADNGTTGLHLSRSSAARIADNAVLSNGSAGIAVEGQSGLGPVLLSDNVIGTNREGLRAAGLGEVRLSGNDLADQMPRQFAGDFSPWLAAYLSSGKTLVIPDTTSPVPTRSSCQKG